MAVSRAEKEQELQELTSAFQAATSAILVDYRGLNVPAVTELRRQLRAANARYRVVKNTLAQKALDGSVGEAGDALFAGPVAIAYGPDPVSAAKVATQFATFGRSMTGTAAMV